MHLDPLMPTVVAALLGVLLIAVLLRLVKQPHVVAYLLAGVLMGPHGIGLIGDAATIERLGALGVVLLLFFIGMEVSPRELIRGWRVSVGGTLFQIVVSVLCVWTIGAWRDWPLARVVLFGFVISLSSTAVVLKLLQENDELETPVGRNVLGILLAQDVAIIPMLIIIGTFGGADAASGNLMLQGTGALLICGLLAWATFGEHVQLPFATVLRQDHEIQVFAALGICFGLSLLTGLFGLSTALGAFVAGILVGAARETQWIHQSLAPFRVLFVALFFVSVGMLVDLTFLWDHLLISSVLVLLVMATNTFINAAILKLLGNSWEESTYAGALLAQIGEFSFVLALVGHQSEIVGPFAYQLAITIISLSLFLSPLWIRLAQRYTGAGGRRSEPPPPLEH